DEHVEVDVAVRGGGSAGVATAEQDADHGPLGGGAEPGRPVVQESAFWQRPVIHFAILPHGDTGRNAR
ncbi:hypothetical protein, partial [Micromonospora sp. KC606]|uniref:hypothetical protein n=1 Tax=Micromonospora sp. KC606 TaxID=2530379 RepID=UPI00140557F5